MSPRTAYSVFAQSQAARIDLPAWRAHATRFYDAVLDLAETLPSVSPGSATPVDTPRALLLLASERFQIEGEISCTIRAATEMDYDAALRAEATRGATGLGTLARRCLHVVRVGPSDDARLALLTAAIVAGTELGPILTDDGDLFGATTARNRLG